VSIDGVPVRVEIDMSPSLEAEFRKIKSLLREQHREQEQNMAVTKQELLDKLAELKKDTTRIIAALKAAVAAQDFTEVASLVDELDASLEAADPEVVEPPTEPTA
jgi:hypothetical protein